MYELKVNLEHRPCAICDACWRGHTSPCERATDYFGIDWGLSLDLHCICRCAVEGDDLRYGALPFEGNRDHLEEMMFGEV